jgi:hypothetical protein
MSTKSVTTVDEGKGGELKETVRTLLKEVQRVRFEGTPYAKLARAHGYADGYMRALLDAGFVTRAELLELVGDERRKFVDEGSGPRVREDAA